MKITKFNEFLNEKKDEERIYTKGCIMLEFGIKKWDKFIKNIIDEKDIYDEEGFGLETDPHVTILYGILPREHDAKEVKEKLLDTDIDLHRYYELKHISIFESKEYDVVKFDLKDCDEVFGLNKYCTEVFDFENDFPDYHPHVTIAYVKKGEGKKYIQKLVEPLIVEPEKLVYSYPNEDGSKNKKDTIKKYEPLDELDEINESIDEKRYRIVSNYGYGDMTWVQRMLSKEQVKEWFVKNSKWTEEDFDDVGIEHFMDSDFTHYVEVDHEDDEEDWDWQDS